MNEHVNDPYELKPCPFCGEDAEVLGSDILMWIECKNCHGQTDLYDTLEEATDAWNRRAE